MARIRIPRAETKATRLGLAAIGVALATSARAEEPAGSSTDIDLPRSLDVRARDVTLDARTRQLLLEGDVAVDDPPFRLRADRLRIHRTTDRGPLVVDGPGRLAFCPCLGPLLAVRFGEALVAPPGDLIVKNATLEAGGVPIAWVPWFWLRSRGEPGLLAPDVEYRGADGLLLGEGFHLPWTRGDEAHGLDVRAGGYVEGGAAVDATLITPVTTTRLVWDHLHGDGLTADARGAVGEDALAWDVDAVRGGRGVTSTTDVDAASRAFDRARAAAALHEAGWTIATSLRSTTARGGDWLDLGAAGPVVSVARGDALGTVGAYALSLDGGTMTEPGRVASFARGEAGGTLADRWGPLGASLALRAAGDGADVGARGGATNVGAPLEGAASDGAASARARLALPLQRAFDGDDPSDPWVHRIEPAVEAVALASRGDDRLGVAPGRGLGAVHGDAWLGESALTSTLGRWGARVGSELFVAAGALGSLDDGHTPSAVIRARAAVSSVPLGLGGELARTWAGASSGGDGGAFSAHARVGAIAGPSLTLLAAERDGVDPVAARVLVDAPLEPSGGLLAAPGWTGGARARIPWTAWLATSGGADVDWTAKELVAARGAIELRDRCGCVRVRATVAHRIGRDGVDAWLAIDLAPSAFGP